MILLASMGVDVPNVARMYDYYLGGSEATEVDRAAAETVLAQAPQVRQAVRENRRFLERAVSRLAAEGITQFLDIGSGLPTQRNVHELLPGTCRVVYVDYDTYVVQRSRELLSTVANATCLRGDVRDLDAVLAECGLDLSRPVGVLMLAVLNFVAPQERPGEILARLHERLVPGSWLALSHGARHEDSAAVSAAAPEGGPLDEVIESNYRRTSGQAFLRTRTEVAELLRSWRVLDPGVVYAEQWPEDRGEQGTTMLYAAVAAHS